MILTVLILLPLVGAIVTAALPSGDLARRVGLVFSVVTLGAGISAAVQYNAGDGMQLTETRTWIESLGVHYALGVDGLGLLMVLLTVVLVPIVLLAGWHESEAPGNNGAKAFFAWTLALEAMSLAVFTATDVLLFYVVFEATLIPASEQERPDATATPIVSVPLPFPPACRSYPLRQDRGAPVPDQSNASPGTPCRPAAPSGSASA